MKQVQLDKLNQELESIMETGKDVADAVDVVAKNADLECIADDDSNQCRIYRTAGGELIYFWFEGIDDQIEWYTDREEEEDDE